MRSSTAAAALGSSNEPPAATVRIAPTRSTPLICLSRYPEAPAMIAPRSASSSECDVSMRQAGGGVTDARRSRHTLTPSPSGSRTSRTATSGRNVGHLGEGQRGGARFADNGDVVLDLQQVRETSADEFVIVQ